MSATVVHSWVDRKMVDSMQERAGEWDVQKLLGDAFKKPGFVIEGRLRNVRSHSIKDGQGRYARYQALVVEVEAIRRRKFDADGKEVDTYTRKTEKARTGYLLSSFEERKLEDAYEVKPDELQKIIGCSTSALPDGFYDAGRDQVHPKKKLFFELWGDHMQFKQQELGIGDHVRLKTKGDTLFLFSLYNSRAAATVPAKFAGEKVGSSWTDNIFKSKAQTEDNDDDQDDRQGVDADEWEDDDDAWN